MNRIDDRPRVRMRPARGTGPVSTIRTFGALGALLASLVGSAAAAPEPPLLPEQANLGPELAAALERPLPVAGLAIAVALRSDDLPPPGAARRAAVQSRQQRVLDALPSGSFVLNRRYESVSGFAGWAHGAAIDALLAHPDTRLVYLDGTVRATLAEGAALVGADLVHTQGITGAGVRVAVIDTGIDTDHPDLADDIAAQQCFCDDHPSPQRGCCPGGGQSGPTAEDVNGHGTAVAGIITSSRATGPGVAPDAEIVAIRVLNDAGSASFSDVAAALDWVLTNQAALGISVVNLSLADGGSYANASLSPCSGTNTANAIEALHAADVSVFVSSGNDGHDGGISFPACVADAISVGGVYDASFGSSSWCLDATCTNRCTDAPVTPDTFVCHANSGALLDLLAPDWRTTTSGLGGGTIQFGGTSAAAPYAAAQAALLIEADPSLTPGEIRTLLTSHGPSVTNPDSGLSFPRSDIEAALASLLPAVCGNGVLEADEACDDGNLIAGDCCSPTCGFELPGSACDDADACTTADTCDGSGSCVSGPPLVCDDGAFCNGVETCDALAGCLSGAPVVCNDDVPCTVDACNEATDSCDHVADDALCDDASFCNGVETCDPVLGCQDGAPVSCGDTVDCTLDACNEVTDSCDHVADDALCDDADPCTAGLCDPLLGCSQEPVPGCGTQVPLVSMPFRLLLALGLLASGLLSGRRWRARRGDHTPQR